MSSALVILFLIYYFTNAYHQKIKDKNRHKIEQLEITKEKELYEAKIDFFTNVAHEIKTPLTLIKGPLEKVIKRQETTRKSKTVSGLWEKYHSPGGTYQSVTRLPANRDQRFQP